MTSETDIPEVLGQAMNDPSAKPPIHPLLIEWLERVFPVTLPRGGLDISGVDGAVDIAKDMARQQGQQDVIQLLKNNDPFS